MIGLVWLLNGILKKKKCKFCAQGGKNSLLVQGAGGNVSFKDNDVLWIKASGFGFHKLVKQKFYR